MSYSITTILHPHEDKGGKRKVLIQVIHKRMKAYYPTDVKVEKECFSEGTIIKTKEKARFNNNIITRKSEIEGRLLDRLRNPEPISKEEFTAIIKGTTDGPKHSVNDFISFLHKNLQGKLSPGRLSHYITISDQIKTYQPNATITEINVSWLNKFEAWLRKQEGRSGKLDHNTLQAKMSILKSILNKANAEGLIKKEQYETYKVPLYKQKLPAYLTQDEMQSFYEALQHSKPTHKLAGYYFLLGCYSGYRLSDMKRFNYNEMVRDNRLRLRAKKNGQIVTLLIHSRLQKVIDYIKDKPLDLSEQKFREYVKSICQFIGIHEHKIHDSRHSFGMLLAESGFSLEEAAELLGDTINVAKIYFRMTNKRIDEKVRERLG